MCYTIGVRKKISFGIYMNNTESIESYEKVDAEKLLDPINIHPADVLLKKFPFAFSSSQKEKKRKEEQEKKQKEEQGEEQGEEEKQEQEKYRETMFA
jgi:hypothetical protein